MDYEMKRISEIRPYENNPRNNEKSVEKVASSIREFGFLQPIVCDGDGVILAGHTRYEAAKRLGLETVPVIYAKNLTEGQAKAYRIADNKVGESSEWVEELLGKELEAILLEAPQIEPLISSAPVRDEFSAGGEAPQAEPLISPATEHMEMQAGAAAESGNEDRS